MHVAIIPPVAHPHLASGPYNLVLPSFLEYRKYRDHYAGQDSYKILDNGAAEGFTLSPSELSAYAQMVGAQEIVVPDALGDLDLTVQRVNHFGHYVARGEWFDERTRFAGVVQGASRNEVVKCLYFYANVCPWITVLMVPRILANTIHRDFRSTFVEAFYDNVIKGRFEAIHFLGCTHYVREVVTLSALPARGIDTSMPIALAMEGTELAAVGQYTGRPHDYMLQEMSTAEQLLAEENIRTFRQWADDFGEVLR